MGHFNATIAAYLQQRRVKFSYLIELRFDVPAYFHSGTLPSITTGGKTWLGLRQLGQIEGISEALNGESRPTRITLSGAAVTSAIMQMAASEDRAAYIGKLGIIWLQFFDEDWALLDDPAAMHAFIIDGLEVDRAEGPNGSVVRSVAVTGDNIFAGRRTPPNGYFTDSDQQQRYPGDRGLEFIPDLLDKTIPVPWGL